MDWTDTPDLVNRVFLDKFFVSDYYYLIGVDILLYLLPLKQFKDEILKHNIFGPVIHFIASIEFQKRGGPHAHMLIRLDEDKMGGRLGSEYVDEFICAEIPDEPDADDQSPAAKEQRTLRELILKLNIHNCQGELILRGRGRGGFIFGDCLAPKAGCRLPQTEEDRLNGVEPRCQKGFPKNYSNETVLGSNRYPQYRRREPGAGQNGTYEKKMAGGISITLTNANVVPYNPYLTKRYRAHVNVEFVGAQGCLT